MGYLKQENGIFKTEDMIPKTTREDPYIEIRIDSNGNLRPLKRSSIWWGGIDKGFFSCNGDVGNTCYPQDLKLFIAALKRKQIKKVKESIATIATLKDKLSNLRKIKPDKSK